MLSEANPNIDCEAQSLLVFSSDSSPRHIWTRIIVLLHSISKFKSEAESYTCVDDPSAEGQSEIIVVVDGSSSTDDGLLKIGSAQEDSLDSITDQLDSKVNDSQALRDNSHHGIELLIQSKTGEVSVSTPTASQDSSTVHSVLPKSHQDRLQHSQTKKITQIMKEKDLKSFRSFGGIDGVADALSSDLVKGLSDEDDIHGRKMKNYFQNQLPKSFFSFLIDTCKSLTVILLLVVAILSLGFGLKEEGTHTGWLDGAILFLMIIVLVLFTSSCKYYHERTLLKKSKKQGVPIETVHVTRGECNQPVSMSDLVHGDIVLLERGYKVPCDGFFIDGKSLEVDSGSQSIIDDNNPFLFYGSRIINGSGRMIVASVGTNTVWSELMRTNSGDKKSKVEAHLDKLMKKIQVAGLLITILIFTASFLWFLLKKPDHANGFRSEVKNKPITIRGICNAVVNIITESKGTARTFANLLSISLVGMMDNMPMVVSIAVTLWNDKVLSDKGTWHDLLACVKSSSITRICTDKIGGLTEHQMEVNMVSVGCDVISDSSNLSPKVLEVLCEGIGTSVLTSADACNAMEASLCHWANDAIGLTSNKLKTNWELLRWTKSDPCINPCGVLIKKTDEDDMCLHWKGPVGEILANCSRYYDKEGNLHRMNSQKKLAFEDVNTDMTKKQLKTVALASRPAVIRRLEGNDLDLIGLIGLKDSGKETTRVAIASAFKEGGVRTILLSTDDVSSLKPIAVEHGLLNQTSDLVLKGEDFQQLTKTERMEKIDRICILGNCHPADKQLFVKCLRDTGEMVAVVGMQTNDAPALKESDIGVAMGNWNSEVARECSDITIWNEGLSFFFDVIFCGRGVYGKLQKFVQVLLIMTISSSLINFIGVIFTGDSPITAIQLFGLNLFMTFIYGMGLLGSPLARRQGNEFTFGPPGPLLNMHMTRNIIVQSSYQIIILISLQQKRRLFDITQESIQPLIFNSLIICQVFNLFIARELQKKNFFKGIHQDFWFWCALAMYILLHALYVAIGCRLARDTCLNYRLWAGCFFIGILSWLVDWFSKLVLPSSRIECFTGWFINSAGKFKLVVFSKDWWLAKSGCLDSEPLPPETNSNLHDPLINTSESLSTPHQNET